MDSDRIMLKSLTLVTLTFYTCFNVNRSHLKTLAARLCTNVGNYLSEAGHLVTIQQVFDLRKYGTSLESTISESTS